jgi:hypothetical protein
VTETVAVRCPRWVVTEAGLALLHGRDLVEPEQAGATRDRQRLELVDRARRVRALQVDGERGAVDLDGSDLLRTHRLRDDAADRDLAETVLRGGRAVDRPRR